MGNSLQLRGDDKAGTLGGYVTWLQDGKIFECALINYHVVHSREKLMEPSGKVVLIGASHVTGRGGHHS